jgi:hypothetical protein
LKHGSDAPFDSIESAQEYLKLLSQALGETQQAIAADVVAPAHSGPDRRLEAMRLVLYKLEKLDQHVTASRRILNDLRTLRRLLMEERANAEAPQIEVPKTVAGAEAQEIEEGCLG